MIASNLFVRNLSEYLEVKNSSDYSKLTNLVHLKSDTNDITVADLEIIYNKVWIVSKNLNGKDRKVINVLFGEAEKIVQEKTEKIK